MDNQNKKLRKASLVLPDKIVETVYDSTHQTTQFAICENGIVEYADFIKTQSGEFFPLDAKSDLLKKNVVLFPSIATKYGTTEQLLIDIKIYIHKYVDISPMFEEIASYYILLTWIYDRFHELPYLRAIGDFGSGKTRFLQVIGSVCYKPIFTGGATTPSPIFRILNDVNGTLVLDEADFKSSDMSDDIVKILNTGYQKGISVLRSEGKGIFEVKAYDVFSPKIIATRETFKDKALESRFLVEEMGRGTLRKDIPRNLRDEFGNEALEFRNKLLMWRFENYNKELKFEDTPIENIHPRLHQIIVPLMAIIDSPEIKNSIKTFIKQYNSELIEDRGLSRESDIIFAILKSEFESNKKEVTVGEIAEYVNKDQDGFDADDRISPRKIGWYLRAKLQLKPYKTRKGFVLNLNRNRERLAFWKERYGITDAEIQGEYVNVENIIEDVPEIKPEDIVF